MSICKWTDDKIMVQLMSLKWTNMKVNRWQNNGATNVIEVSICKWTDDKIMVQLMSLKCQYVSEQIEQNDKIMVQLMSLKCQYVSEQMTK